MYTDSRSRDNKKVRSLYDSKLVSKSHWTKTGLASRDCFILCLTFLNSSLPPSIYLTLPFHHHQPSIHSLTNPPITTGALLTSSHRPPAVDDSRTYPWAKRATTCHCLTPRHAEPTHPTGWGPPPTSAALCSPSTVTPSAAIFSPRRFGSIALPT
jgi:hypothetical protein